MRLSSRKIAILTAREVTRSRSRRASYCRCATIPRARTPLIEGGARMQALRRTVLVDDEKDRATSLLLFLHSCLLAAQRRPFHSSLILALL